VRPARNLGATDGPNDLAGRAAAPEAVRRILADACYDCHSNRTGYPWYANVQPVGWWLAHHVKEGKRELNFTEFGAYAPPRAERKLGAIVREVQKGDMPLASYQWMHPKARLTDADRRLLVDWINSLRTKSGPP